MLLLSLAVVLTPLAAYASATLKPLTPYKNLVTFGDSYTDVVVTGDGGVSWPTYAAGYGNLNLFPFARAGATCSNNITFRPVQYPMSCETVADCRSSRRYLNPKSLCSNKNCTMGH